MNLDFLTYVNGRPGAQMPSVTDSVMQNSQNLISGVDQYDMGVLSQMPGGNESAGGGIPVWGQGNLAQTGLGAVNTLTNAWLGMRSLDMAKKNLAENKRQFNLNFESNKRLTNARLRDRQKARLATGGGNYQSVGDYMNQNGVQ